MISPQGYNLGEEPKSKNPFWDGEGEDSDVNRIYATATVDDSVGTPSVQTTKSVDGHDITFGFNFHNLKGRDGTNGTDGSDGQDGVSPTITITDITGGHRVSITDVSGTHAFDVMNGTNGRDGRDGTNGRDGTDGISPSVSVSDITGGHRITVTDATGSETFDVMNGTDGRDGTNGTDGVSPTIDVVTIAGGHRVDITDAQGSESFNVMDGQNGTNGTNGQDGVSPTVSVTSITGGHQVSITDAQGTDTFNVMDGQDGADGQNGTNGQDGVTPDITMTATADATSSANPTVSVTKGGTAANPTFALAFSGLKGDAGTNGQGVPTGGTAGQVLAKVDGTDYNTEWITPSGGGGGYTPKRYTFSGTPTIEVVNFAKQGDASASAGVRVHVGPIQYNETFASGSETLSMNNVESLIMQGKGHLLIYGMYSQSRPSKYHQYYVMGSLSNYNSGYYVEGCTDYFEYSGSFALYFIRTAQ